MAHGILAITITMSHPGFVATLSRPPSVFGDRLVEYHTRVGQAAAHLGVRKVRAPKGKMPANGWAGRPDGSVPQKRKLPCACGRKAETVR